MLRNIAWKCKKAPYFLLFIFILNKSIYAEGGQVNNDTPIIRYSLMEAIKEGYLYGNLTVGEAKKQANFGVGGFESFSAELIMLDGNVYNVSYDSLPIIAKNTDKITYIEMTNFKPTIKFFVNTVMTRDEIMEEINKKEIFKNLFYSVKIQGEFPYMEYWIVGKQKKPYSNKICARYIDHVFFHNKISGTIFGFIHPSYVKGGIDYPGWHMHFLSDDKKIGGHVHDFMVKNAVVEIAEHNEYTLKIPENINFSKLNLSKDIQCPAIN